MSFGINVFDFGAKGDGITDDTKAIQSAINYASEKGGGRILFPYTPKGYRIASEGIEEYKGRKVRSQIVIPPENNANIYLEGEMPCRFMNLYSVRTTDEPEILSPTLFGGLLNDNTFLFSDWDAPEVTDPSERPWAIIAAPEGDVYAGHFSVTKFSMSNIELRVAMRQDKMYPTQSAANFQNISRVSVSDCQFCVNESVGDAPSGKELKENPCHTIGLMMSGDQNDHNSLRSVAVQGFKYGFVLGEHVVADYLYVHNCEEGVVFHDSSHLSSIGHIVAQHNRCILSTTRGYMFGHKPGPCNIVIGTVNMEGGAGLRPEISQLKYGIYDPENRLHGSLVWHEPWGEKKFPVIGAKDFNVTQF